MPDAEHGWLIPNATPLAYLYASSGRKEVGHTKPPRPGSLLLGCLSLRDTQEQRLRHMFMRFFWLLDEIRRGSRMLSMAVARTDTLS